jgi:heme exporter protein B
VAAKLWWLIHKDLVSEWRALRAWPAMLLLGVLVAVVFAFQMDLLPQQKRQMAGSLLWLAILFAGMVAIDRSFAAEREEGCWDGLRLYPLSPAALYLAKLAVNVLAVGALQCVLVPLFAVLADVPLLAHPLAMILVAMLGNLGFTAVGTLLGALSAAVRRHGSPSLLLVLPLVIPVVLAAAEATRLITVDDLGPAWWRWVQLLGAFAIVFVTAGTALFSFVVEE